MDRRKSIFLLGTGSLLLSQNSFPVHSMALEMKLGEDDFMEAFTIRWEGLKTHTFEVFEAMPGDKFSYRPTQEVMSFAKLFSHIGFSLDIYAEVLDGATKLEEPTSENRDVVFSYLQTRFRRFEDAVRVVNPENLYTRNHFFSSDEPWKNFTIFDIIMLSYNHAVHHKGQATTYLRLQGVKPPQYRF